MLVGYCKETLRKFYKRDDKTIRSVYKSERRVLRFKEDQLISSLERLKPKISEALRELG